MLMKCVTGEVTGGIEKVFMVAGLWMGGRNSFQFGGSERTRSRRVGMGGKGLGEMWEAISAQGIEARKIGSAWPLESWAARMGFSVVRWESLGLKSLKISNGGLIYYTWLPNGR